jgi:hypothetical protein
VDQQTGGERERERERETERRKESGKFHPIINK